MEVDGRFYMRIEFGFDNPKFSDRILRIEPTRDSLHEHSNDSSSSGSSSPCGAKTVHICSLVLASHSPFFRKMFSDGMRESEQQAVTLSVHASEVEAMLDLLQFMYSDKLKADTCTDLLKVLILADRFQVVTCVAHCVQRLPGLSMSFELAASCINLPSSVLEGGNSQLKSLIDKATCFLSKNFSSHIGEALKLPLESIKKLMSWDSLEVACEDEVYDFLLKWAMIHYKDLRERCRVFSSELFPLVRLPYMSSEKIKGIPQCKELEQCDATKRVVEALLSKYANYPSNDATTSLGQGRAYKLKPVLVTVLVDGPYRECIVHSKLKRDECIAAAKSSVKIGTQKFHFGNESFYLEFGRLPEGKSYSTDSREFTVALWRCSSKSNTQALNLDVEIAVRLKTSSEFTTEKKGSCALLNGCNCYVVIGESWDSFISEDSQYLIDGVLYVRVTLRLK